MHNRANVLQTQVIGQALSMLVNIMFRSDANRGLAEECGVTVPTITIIDAVDDEGVLVQVRGWLVLLRIRR